LELVYLWVENYKNIHHQGFNFSPRFHCEYNEKDKELTINENDDYIPDFFGKNINITAIVGKNGSGKSSVLEYLSDNPEFIIAFENDEFWINEDIEDIEVINKTKYKYTKNKIDLDSVYIPSSDYLHNNIDYFYKEKDIRETTFSHFFENSHENIWQSRDEITLRQFNMFFISNKHSLRKIIFPKNIILSFGVFSFNFTGYSYEKELDAFSLSEYTYLLAYLYMLEQYSVFKELNDSFFLKKEKLIRELFLESEYLIEDKKALIEYKKLKNYCSSFDNCSDIFIYKKDKLDGAFESRFFKVPIKYFTKEVLLFLDYFDDDINNCQFIWDTKFSSGEIAFINLLASIFHELQNGKLLLYIDEGESFLHPNWQKKYISYIVQFIKDNFPNRKIHLILTSHSPFFLSDIPKQNIIFLDKDEDENCQVLKHNEVLEKKQTFGANIHTLLSDSFFMEDGLMGEFAKSKIIQIQKFHKKVLKYQENEKVKKAYIYFYNKKQKEFEQIQKIIGEPFLKTIVKNQLEEIETILFKDKAKQLAIQRFIREFGEDAINEVIKNGKA